MYDALAEAILILLSIVCIMNHYLSIILIFNGCLSFKFIWGQTIHFFWICILSDVLNMKMYVNFSQAV